MSNVSIPRDDLFNPVLESLHKLGGSGTIQEIHDVAVTILGLSEEQIQKLFQPDKGNQTEIAYRLAWARTWLRRYGLLENSSRGVWALTAKGLRTEKVDPKELDRSVKEMVRKEREGRDFDPSPKTGDLHEPLPKFEGIDDKEQWREYLFNVLLQLHPTAFERLCQRVLRESGFTHVTVTGRSGDGGINGIGVMRIGRFLSFRVLFQCKRYKGAIGAGVVRDFRGAMVGRTDKGLIVTTGNYTPAAKKEATRDGAPEIDLLDGEQLIDKLKELELGVETEKVVVERVVINEEWFRQI